MQISGRLKAVAALVPAGGCLADIGTDHGYIPIYLIKDQKVTHAIAMDVNRGPLARAREHIVQYGLEEKIETRLSDGLEALRAGEADTIVIAGMGGPLTVRILEMGKEKLSGCGLVLQPQSGIRTVRLWLEKNDWRIVREDMVCEDGKYYPMMRAVQTQKSSGGRCREYTQSMTDLQRNMDPRSECIAGECTRSMTELQLCYGPLLLRGHHPVLREFLLREQRLNRRILESLEKQSTEAASERAQEIRAELERIEEALDEYGCGWESPTSAACPVQIEEGPAGYGCGSIRGEEL